MIQSYCTYNNWQIFSKIIRNDLKDVPYINGIGIKHPLNRKWINFMDKRLLILYLSLSIFLFPIFLSTFINGRPLSIIYLMIGFGLFTISWIIYNVYEYLRSKRSLNNNSRNVILDKLRKEGYHNINSKLYYKDQLKKFKPIILPFSQ